MVLYRTPCFLSIPKFQIPLKALQIRKQDPVSSPLQNPARIQFLKPEMLFSPCGSSLPETHHILEPEIIKSIPAGKIQKQERNPALRFEILHKPYLMLMNICQRERIAVAFLRVKTDRNALHHANVIWRLSLSMRMGVIGVGTFWISARRFSRYCSLVRLITSSRSEPLSPLEFHVAIFPASSLVTLHLYFSHPILDSGQ